MDLDTQDKIAALEAALAGDDTQALYEEALRARIAAEFRATDAMIGLPPPDEALVERMRALADQALERAAERGHLDAGVEVANRIYFSRNADRADAAFAYASRARENPRAHYLLGLFAYTGFGAPKDEVKSLDHHLKAAEAGESDAMFELYVFYAKGIGTAVDLPCAVAWCHRAAEAGSTRAMYNLGGFYATGNGVEQDGPKAIYWYGKAAEAGHGRAAATLGVMYATGDSVAADHAKAKELFALAGALHFPWEDFADQCGLDPADYE